MDNLLPIQLKIKRPFVISGITIAVAVVLMLLCGIRAVIPLFICALIVTVFIIAKFPAFARHTFIVLVALLAAASSFTMSSMKVDTAYQAVGKSRHIQGTVCSYPAAKSSGSSFFVLTDCMVEDIPVPGKICVYTDNTGELRPGDRIVFTAYSLAKSSDEGIFYYHSLSDGEYLTALCYDGIEMLGSEGEDSLYSHILTLRKYVSERFFKYMGQDEAAVVNALVTGDKNYLSPGISTAVKMSGISHIFAVSGMHLAIWTGLFFLIFKQRSYSQFLPNFFASVFVLFYCAFTGFSPSVMRSGIMLLTVFAGRIIRKAGDSLNSLGLAATALLIYEPFLIGNVSFLLSFIATIAVVTTTEKMSFAVPFAYNKPIKEKIKDLRYKITNPLMLSLSVMLMTMPVVCVFFGYFSVFSPVSSLIMTPVAEALMITGGLAQLFPDGFFLTPLIFSFADFFGGVIIDYISFIGSFDFSITTLPLSVLVICMAIAGVLYLLIPVIFRRKRTFALYVLMNVIAVLVYSVCVHIPDIDKTYIYIPANQTEVCISVCSYGKFSAVYGTGSRYADVTENCDYLIKKGNSSADFVFFPEYSARKKSNMNYITAMLSPEYVFSRNEKDDTRDDYSFTASLSDKADIYSVSEKNYCAAAINLDGVKAVICSGNDEDFAEKHNEFTSGDILICENSIPLSLDKNNFDKVIILTDEEIPVQEGIYTNKDKAIEITVKGESYAVN